MELAIELQLLSITTLFCYYHYLFIMSLKKFWVYLRTCVHSQTSDNIGGGMKSRSLSSYVLFLIKDQVNISKEKGLI